MPADNPAAYMTGGGAGFFGPSPSSADPLGVPEPDVMPGGGVGDVDSLLRQIQSGQFSAEALLPLLMMLAQAPIGEQAVGPPPIPGGDPIDQAFGEIGPAPDQGIGPTPEEEMPPELLAMLGGGIL